MVFWVLSEFVLSMGLCGFGCVAVGCLLLLCYVGLCILVFALRYCFWVSSRLVYGVVCLFEVWRLWLGCCWWF